MSNVAFYALTQKPAKQRFCKGHDYLYMQIGVSQGTVTFEEPTVDRTVYTKCLDRQKLLKTSLGNFKSYDILSRTFSYVNVNDRPSPLSQHINCFCANIFTER